MKQYSRVTCVLLTLLVCGAVMIAQQVERRGTAGEHPTDKQGEEIQELFHKIERAMLSGSLEDFQTDFHSVVSLTLHTREKGIYSSHQTAAILSAYVKDRRVVSCNFSTMQLHTSSPYATGRILTVSKGNRESSQIYVSLSSQRDRWVISQFFIY